MAYDSQQLVLQQAVECVVAHGAYDKLVLQQAATYTITRNVAAQNMLALKSEGVGYLPSKYWYAFDAVVEVP